MEHISKLFTGLSDKKVRYLVCGGLAVNVYGIPRMTADIDLLVDFTEQNILDFEAVLKNQNYKEALPIALHTLIDKAERADTVKNKNLIAFSYFNAMKNLMNIDVLIDVPLAFEELWKRRTIKVFNVHEVFFVSLDDLILLKKYSNRIQDKQDILLLSKIKNGKK